MKTGKFQRRQRQAGFKEMKTEDENGDGKGDRTQRWNV